MVIMHQSLAMSCIISNSISKKKKKERIKNENKFY